MDKTVDSAGVVGESRVVNISVVPGSVFVIAPIAVVDWTVLFMVEEEEAIVVVFRIEGIVNKTVVLGDSVATTIVV